MGAGASVDGSQGGLVSLALSAEMAKPLDGSDLSTGAEATTAFAAKSEVARLRRLLADPRPRGLMRVKSNSTTRCTTKSLTLWTVAWPSST